jgi:hypothetical protein
VNSWRIFYSSLLFVWVSTAGFAQEERRVETVPHDRTHLAQGLERYLAAHQEQVSEGRNHSNCLEWKNGACTVCGIDSTIDLSLKNKKKTPILLCHDMRPGPARLVMSTHAQPAISGTWELEFGLGYQTSARDECPHQFVASNSPPLKSAYEIGPISIEGEIPSDGMIQAFACVGLSSARVGREGKESGVELRGFSLRVISD